MLELIATIAAVVAALATFWQANEARRARADAETAQENAATASAAAAQHEKAALDSANRSALAAEESAAASTRSADAAEESAAAGGRAAAALERANQLFEEANSEPPEPWEVTHEGNNVWAVTNRTGYTLIWAQIDSPFGFSEDRFKPRQDYYDNLPPGGRMIFDVVDGLAKSITLWVHWGDPRSIAHDQQRWVKEIDLY